MNRIELEPNSTTESQRNGDAQPTPTLSARRPHIAVIIIALILIGALMLGFLPRWHQRKTAMSDMDQLAIPTVSVVSPILAKSESGLVLPAEIKPWR